MVGLGAIESSAPTSVTLRQMKVYQSKSWLTRKYITQRMTEEEIAKEAGTTQATINRWLKKFNLHKSQR